MGDIHMIYHTIILDYCHERKSFIFVIDKVLTNYCPTRMDLLTWFSCRQIGPKLVTLGFPLQRNLMLGCSNCAWRS